MARITKSSHRQYLASESWLQRRKQYLLEYDQCNRCELPRYIAVIAYDQDLNVHHRNYQRVGAELDSDLEALCRRCHEIETFGKTEFRAIWSSLCIACRESRVFDRYGEGICDGCVQIEFLMRGRELERRQIEKEQARTNKGDVVA